MQVLNTETSCLLKTNVVEQSQHQFQELSWDLYDSP